MTIAYVVFALIFGFWIFAAVQHEKNQARKRELRAYERGWNDGRKWTPGEVTFAEDMIPMPIRKWWERL